MRVMVVLTFILFLASGCDSETNQGSSETEKSIGKQSSSEPSSTLESGERTAPPQARTSGATASVAPNAPAVNDSPASIAAEMLSEQARHEAQSGTLSTTTQLHDQYEAEDRQDDWASFVEEKLRMHFTGARIAGVDVIHIACKTSICELVALTRDSKSNSLALTNWQNEIYSLPRQEWWRTAQMREPAFQVSSARDGRALFVTHLMRSVLLPSASGSAP